MESLLFRTASGSVPVQNPLIPGSPRRSVSLPVQDSVAAGKSGASSPRISLHMKNIRRSSSESDIKRSQMRSLSKLGSRSCTSLQILEEECDEGAGRAGDRPASNRNSGGGSGGNGSDDTDRLRIEAYYEEMLKSDPTNSLLLRNYGKHLHEVEMDVVKAEEYYARAILAEPGDGEVLSLYGKLIWETQRDETRAKSYFNQALHASPDDCMVLGSYAHFLWEAEDEDEVMEIGHKGVVPIAAMAEAF